GASDADASDVLHVAGLTLTGGDASGVIIDGDGLSVDPSAYDYLAVGETAVITYSYDIVDGHGGAVAQTAAITITGANDAPVNTVPVSQTVGSNTATAITGVAVADIATSLTSTQERTRRLLIGWNSKSGLRPTSSPSVTTIRPSFSKPGTT
ncbi:VCBS domain-containing protein, partial [Sinorhizobium fredii]|uniref:VCBS domain-containing protein n=1 Tax=Rhizobium fredii TaxID=380 RepID=UPI00055F7F98